MLLTVGIDSVFAGVDIAITVLRAEFKFFGRLKREVSTLIYCGVYFLLGLIFCTKGGIYLFEFFDHYGAGPAMLFFVINNSYSLAFKFKLERLSMRLKQETGEEIGPLLRIVFKWV